MQKSILFFVFGLFVATNLSAQEAADTSYFPYFKTLAQILEYGKENYTNYQRKETAEGFVVSFVLRKPSLYNDIEYINYYFNTNNILLKQETTMCFSKKLVSSIVYNFENHQKSTKYFVSNKLTEHLITTFNKNKQEVSNGIFINGQFHLKSECFYDSLGRKTRNLSYFYEKDYPTISNEQILTYNDSTITATTVHFDAKFGEKFEKLVTTTQKDKFIRYFRYDTADKQVEHYEIVKKNCSVKCHNKCSTATYYNIDGSILLVKESKCDFSTVKRVTKCGN